MSNCPCKPKLAGLARFGDHPAVIIAAYLVVIFPWGIMQNVGFISEKWRTVRHTRHLGYVHLSLSIIPLPYIIFYAHLQQISSDYKEMMAAVVVILMAIYHICRTIWGLMQLGAYHAWCTDLMQRMLELKMVRAYEWRGKLYSLELSLWEKVKRKFGKLFDRNNDNEIDWDVDPDTLVDEYDQVIEKMDCMLKVNNEMVGNNFAGTDLAVSIDWNKVGLRRPSEWLKTAVPELCSCKWGAAFLCEFGTYWASPSGRYFGGHQRKFLEKLFSSYSRSLDHFNYVTFPVNGERTSILNNCSDISGKSGVYGCETGEIDEYYVEELGLVADNVASAYPTEKIHEKYVFIELIVAIMRFKRIEHPALSSIKNYAVNFPLFDRSSGWKLLLWHEEIPADKTSDLLDPRNIPPFPWGYLSVPLWDACTNWRVLQATVHLDNFHNELWRYNPPENSPPTQPPPCYFEYTRKIVVEKFSLSTARFSGCVMEMARTFLADWIHARPSDAPDPHWSPLLPTDSLEFPSKLNHYSRIWECQCLLQESIANMGRVGQDIPASPYLIMLFVLAFPGTEEGISALSQSQSCRSQSRDTISIPQSQETSSESDNDDGHYTFNSPFAPQDIKVGVGMITNNGETKTVMSLVAGSSVERFMWADWIDAAMGYMKGLDDVESKNPRIPEHVRNWRKRTPWKCDLSRPILIIPKDHPELPDLPGDIQVWTGWPMFDVKVVQFEMNQWLQSAGLIHRFGEVFRSEVDSWDEPFEEEVKRAEAGLLKIMEWNRG